jgi:UDP-GlcNAc:undecaprenyl-phosphate GlcNAc-1-phosphate transferase
LAVLVTVFGGVVLDKVTNPWGGVVAFDQLTSLTLSVLLPSLLAFVWIMGVMYTIKIVDGLDGLATGIVSIGSLIIFALSMSTKFYQPNVGLLALIFVGACLGFLVLNFSPAKLFLGESGSLFLGFILAVLSIISGSKVATAFLVLAVPMLDLARVIILRLYRKQSVFQGDRRHLHYALLELGWSERQVVLVFYTAATLFGLGALFLQSFGKLVLIALISIIMLVIGIILSFKLRTLKV